MIYASVCDGIGAVHVAWIGHPGPWHPAVPKQDGLGWTCAWTSEIEAFPAAVVEHHYHLPNMGDVNAITAEDAARFGKLDLLVAGFPCQDLSVAGQRKGLVHEGQATRSGLFFRIVELCDAIGQRWTLLENVPGLLSSHDGEDFRTVVGTLCGASFPVPGDGWRNAGFAAGPKGLVEWFVLDAQFTGVAQRRRRVFIVRDSGEWWRRPPLLSFPESLRGNPPPGREAGTRTAAGGAGCITGRGTPIVPMAIQEDNQNGVTMRDTAGSLRSDAPGTQPCGTMVFQTRIARNGRGQPEEVCPTLQGAGAGATSDMRPCVAVAQNQRGELRTSDVHPQLTCGGGKPGDGYPCVDTGYAVRRLSPRECCRLQGFPDDYTLVEYRGKPAADLPRYRAIGNSMAVPVMAWIGRRIDGVDGTAKPTTHDRKEL